MRAEAISRVKLVFSLLDVNGNGRIEAEDFELMAQRVAEAAHDSAEPAKSAMNDAFRRYWATLSAELDADRDGGVDFDEYTACVLSPERFDETVTGFAEALAALGDPDGDGLVERDRFAALMEAIGFERANIDALFDAFGPSDADRIPVVTWADGIKDYYAPDKAGIPGDHLVGDAAA
ncbi:EF-hand domain-containing protein [Streptomyces johnsoniae]|uniref:EF-hand domain-containing protein n=1 Tax=Streptomyces johnsoniae TaxID=3075532 RepID=A0ABU2SDK9_9ACTN|nr:EF-hand domain-containing protein [Streptomyces sp. DSM 41886]MDT0447056.1 EF-hand domain-containing protein [Streptomyces sp. DSM 41886]